MVKNIKEGENVKLLIGDGDKETLSEETYEIIEIIDKHAIKVRTQEGLTLNVHKCRIKREEEKMSEEETTKVEAKPSEKPKKVKKPKATPFDLLAWREECGGDCLQKQCEFDHTNYKLIALVCVNGDTGFFHTINTYEYPDGTISVGKNITGNKYPLKGKKINRKTKKDGETQTTTLKGTQTADEVKERYVKKGYSPV